MFATCVRVTRSLPCGNPNASRTDERPVQLTRTDGHVTRIDGHVDDPEVQDRATTAVGLGDDGSCSGMYY